MWINLYPLRFGTPIIREVTQSSVVERKGLVDQDYKNTGVRGISDHFKG